MAALATPSPAEANAKYAGIVVDAKTGKVLYANRADSRRYPASLTKIMTLYVIFEELEAGRLTLDSEFTASAYAAGRPPSKVGLRAGRKISVRDAIGALVTKSANDVAATVAENISGSEAAFAKRMTRTAHQLGMRSTQFRNASGLPDNEQVTTATDMARLGRAIQERFPDYYDFFKMRSYTYKGRRYGNHNRLLGNVRGVDGIKTGYIRASGFNLVTSVQADGRHIVAVVFGGRTGRSRDAQMRKLIAQYLPKASTGPRTAPMIAARPIVVAGPAPLPEANPRKQVLAAKPKSLLPPAPVAEVAMLAPPAPIETPSVIAEGDTDAEEPVVVASVVPAQKAKVAPSRDAATPTGWQIQIAAVPSKDAAMTMLREAHAKGGAALRGRELYTETVASGGETLYRARFAGFESKRAAWSACKTLQQAKYNCYAVNP